MDEQLELAWAAGFYDGEGSTVFLLNQNSGRISVEIAQIDRRVLDRFQKAVGLGKVYGPYTKKSATGNRVWNFCCRRNESTLKILKKLWPYLGEVKKQQALLAVEKLDGHYAKHPEISRGGNIAKTHCPRGHEYTVQNTRYGKNGDRNCRACGRERYHERKAKVLA